MKVKIPIEQPKEINDKDWQKVWLIIKTTFAHEKLYKETH